MGVCIRSCTCECSACRGQKKLSGLLEMEFGSCLMVLGIKLRSSTRVVHALTARVVHALTARIVHALTASVVHVLTAEPSLQLADCKYFREALCICGHQEFWNEFRNVLAFPFCGIV